MTLLETQIIFSKMWGEFLHWITMQQGYGVTHHWGFRDEDVQKRMVKAGLSKTIDSAHCKKLAQDIDLFISGILVKDKNKYRHLGEKWEAVGKEYGVDARWGGRFGIAKENYTKEIGWDVRHFEIFF